MKRKIYLDYSATTPVDKKVMQVMRPYFCDKFGNPSSIHNFGQEAIAGVDKAREQVARFLNCEPNEIIFTSGATEADNLAIKGVVKALLRHAKRDRKGRAPIEKLHIITSSIEHPAVLEPCRELEEEGVEVTYLPVLPNGIVDIEELKKAIKENTVLVSIMYVNSEVGTIQPIRKIGKIIKKINEKKLKDWKNTRPALRKEKPQPIYFHTDATQAINFLNCDVRWNYVDLLSMSSHKIYGPKGVGALYVKSSVPIEPLQLGGHQENNLRSGTLNVPGIVGFGKAVELLTPHSQHGEVAAGPVGLLETPNNKKIAKLRDMLVSGIMKNIPDVVLNTDRGIATPAHANFSFLGVEGEAILISLDLEGIAVSTGSACASGKLEPSHVLLAMGVKQEVAHNSIRFSLGKFTTAEEIKRVVKILPPIIKRLRKMSPVKT
jgi:cysteine desulfurase